MSYSIVFTKDGVMSLKFVVIRYETGVEEVVSEDDTAEEAMYYKETLERTFPSERFRVEVRVG